MANNFINNNGLGSMFNKPFGFNIFPERTMRQVKESAFNLLKDVVKPITSIGEGKEDILNGVVSKEINTYQNIINSIYNNMSAVDKNAYKSLDFKS